MGGVEHFSVAAAEVQWEYRSDEQKHQNVPRLRWLYGGLPRLEVCDFKVK
jgi:hypothetical protein